MSEVTRLLSHRRQLSLREVKIAIENWLQGLTPREDQAALLVGRGLSNKEVARELGVSKGTVKQHVHNIFQKLGAKSRYGLIMQIVSSGSAERHVGPDLDVGRSLDQAC